MKLNKTNRKYTIRFFLRISVFGFLGFMQYLKRKEGKRNYILFYNSDIMGVLQQDPDASAGATYFTIKGKRYNFFPTVNAPGNKSFSEFAKKGDSIYKPKRADTLKLIKNREEYSFPFQKL